MRFAITFRNSYKAENAASDLARAGFGVDLFENFSDVTEAILNHSYDLVLMDSRLGDGNAIEWLRCFGARKLLGSTFIVVLSDREEERIAALEAGADDSAVSLLSGRELVARIRAILRRPRERRTSSVSLGNLSICTVARVVTVAGRELVVQRREAAILEVLLRRAGNVVPRGALEHDVYGMNSDCAPNSLEVRISRLRRHLSSAGASPLIETVRGVGYRLVDAGVTDAGLRSSCSYPQVSAA